MAPDQDVVIVGDGPAGAALAAECAALGLDTAVVGRGLPWGNTYGMWLDEVEALPPDVFAGTRDRIVVVAAGRHEIARPYGVIDNASLRSHLDVDRHLVRDVMTGITPHRGLAEVELLDGGSVTGRVVVDATGAAAGLPPAWQTAFGVVVGADVVRSQFTVDAVTLMDWSVTGEAPTFCYVVPLAHGWLAQETALASREPVAATELRRKLAQRLGEGVVADAESDGPVEHVQIPMGLPIERGSGHIVRFGAAAGMLHPVTGYSVAASLRAAPRVAQAIAAGTDVHEAVWPSRTRRTRVLHDRGLAALLRLDPLATTDFFEAFFSLPVERWAPYLSIDSRPRDVARAMRGVFRAAPWSVRRRLARLDRRRVTRRARG